MNKLGLFWAKNTTHILGIYFLGWAIWACLHWASLCLVQKLLMGLFFLLVAHEYEEAYKERFIRVMGQAIRITPEELPVPGLIHVAAACSRIGCGSFSLCLSWASSRCLSTTGVS